MYTCSTCKGKLVEGRVDYGVYQKKALPDFEREQGKALFCQAKPLSDLVIEARTVGAAKGIQIKTLPCRVQQMERVADDVMVLRLKLPEPAVADLANGLHLIVLEDRRVPRVTFTLLIPGAGGYYDPDDMPGLASATAAMMAMIATTTRISTIVNPRSPCLT